MGAGSAGIVEGSSLERLTHAIRRGFAAIEKMYPDAFFYENVSLRGALERRVYQEALLDPGRLDGLAQASGDRSAFSEWLLPRVAATPFRDTWRYVKALLRLIEAGLRSGVRRDTGHGPEFVFHALRPRFIDFFQPVIEKLGSQRCAIFCEPGYGVEDAAARHGLKVCERTPERLRRSGINRPPRSVFALYSVAVVSLLDALGTLRRHRPRAVVFAEAASFQEEILARAARALGVATVRLQYGRAGLLSPGYYEMPYDKMLMWGDGFVERLRGPSPDCQYVVTGSPLMDKLARGQSQSSHKLFADGGPVVTVISQPECASISRQDYATLTAIVDRALRANQHLRVLVRLHPADKATDFDRLAKQWPAQLRVTASREFPLDAVIGASVLVVGLYSTVLSEAAAAGVLPVVVRLGARHRVFPSPEEEGAAVLVTTPDEAVGAINSLASDASARKRYEEAMMAFTRKYFGPADGRAIDRIAEQIEAVA